MFRKGKALNHLEEKLQFSPIDNPKKDSHHLQGETKGKTMKLMINERLFCYFKSNNLGI